LENSGWVLCKGIDHAGTQVMFLKSLLSIAETPCLGATRREMMGAFPALNCILWAKIYSKIGSFTYLWIYHKRTPELFFPYLISTYMILMFSSVGIWATPSGSNFQKKKRAELALWTWIVKHSRVKQQNSSTDRSKCLKAYTLPSIALKRVGILELYADRVSQCSFHGVQETDIASILYYK
jgi:hypothetical protein